MTLVVNIHGARVSTSHQVLVGMMVTVENLRNGQGGKAICVQVYDAVPGEATHDIALQLLHPGNIWGVENPPADWEFVAAELGGRTFPSEDRAKIPVAAFGAASAAPVRPRVPEVPPEGASAQLAGLEKRAAQIVEAASQSLRARVDEIASDVQRDFHQQLQVMVKAAQEGACEGMKESYTQLESALETLRAEALADMGREAIGNFDQRISALTRGHEQRIAQRIDQAFAELEAALVTFRSGLGDELTAQKEQVLRSVELALRARVAAMLSTVLTPAGEVPATQQLDPAVKK